MTTITTARGIVGYDTFGDDGAPPLVLIQGFSAQRLGWHPGFCQALADQGFYVIRFDNRDVGESEHYPGVTYTIADLADDTVAVLDALDLGSVDLVGQSMGGMIAQLVATGHPSRVRSLGLLYTTASTRHFVDAGDAVARSQQEFPTTRAGFVAKYVADEANCASTAYPQDTEWLTELANEMWDAGVDPTGIQRQIEALLVYPDQVEADGAITVPTAIFAGTADRLIDWHASEELHHAIPDSTLTIFPGMGHELPAALWPQITELLRKNTEKAHV